MDASLLPSIGEMAVDHSFLNHVDAQKGRWRDAAAEAKGISTRYYWLGKGNDALEGVVAIPANLASVMYLQLQMVAAIVHMGGHDVKSDRVRSVCYACLYQESAELPLLLRGPGVAAGKTNDLASIVDVRATLATLAGTGGDVGYDERSLASLFSSTPSTWRKRLLFERPPAGTKPGWYALHEPPHIFIEWTTQAKELYDLATDTRELQSQHATNPNLVSQFSSQLASIKAAQGAALGTAEVA